MGNIKPIIGDDEPFITCFYRDVPNGFRFADIGDDFLTDYITDLELYYNDFEIVGTTLKSFKNLLKVTWNRKSEIVKKYANYDKTNIHYTYDTVNTRVVEYDESTNVYNNGDSTNTHIDTPISNDDDTPSNIDTNQSSNTDNMDKEYTQTETLTLDDGDIKKVNELTDSYRSVLDVLISVFKPCFVRFESYSY